MNTFLYPFKLIIVALQFFTRIPIAPSMHVEEQDLGFSTAMFPIIGAIVGAILAAMALLMNYIGLIPSIAAAVILGAEALVTGAFHWDGLADSFDGFFSTHKNKEEKLAIMHDSRIGVMGTMAIVSIALVQVSAFSYLFQLDSVSIVIAVLSAYMIGKWSSVVLIASEKYGKKTGKGMVFLSYGSWKILLISSLFIFPLLAAYYELLLACASVLLFILFWRKYCNDAVGGVTGDTLGAAIRISETIVLIILCIVW